MSFQSRRSRWLLGCVFAATLLTFSTPEALGNKRSKQPERIPPIQSNQTVKQAIDNSEQSYSNYFKALRKNPNASAQERAKLRNEIISPASNQLTESIGKQTSEMNAQALAKRQKSKRTKAQVQKSKEQREKKRELKALARLCKKTPSDPKCKDLKLKKTKTTSEPASGTRRGGLVQPSGPSRPEVTLDGSGIEKEIQFEKKPKSKGPMELPEWKPSDGDVNEVTGSKPAVPAKKK